MQILEWNNILPIKPCYRLLVLFSLNNTIYASKIDNEGIPFNEPYMAFDKEKVKRNWKNAT